MPKCSSRLLSDSVEFTIKVAVYQPVIPDYRVPFFSAIARRSGVSLTVFASRTFPGCPDTVNKAFDFKVQERRAAGWFGNRVFWQYDMRIPNDFGRGDVIVLSGNVRILSNFYLFIQARMRGVAIVWWTHGWSPGSTSWSFWIRRQIMRHADLVLLYTDAEVDRFRPYWRGPALVATNNTIDTTDVELARQSWNELALRNFQQDNGLLNKRVILFSSRLVKSKNVGLLLRALKILADRDDRYVLVIVGDGPERVSLEALARELGLEGRIVWTGEVYDQEKLAPWFLSARAFAYPGPIGLSIMHAFAYSLPVIAHDHTSDHNPEYAALRPGENGLLFERDNETSLAAAVNDLFASEAGLNRMATAAYETIHGQFSMSGMVDRFVAACVLAVEQRINSRLIAS